MVIQQAHCKLLSFTENNPTGAVADGITSNFLYVPRAGKENKGSAAFHQDKMEALYANVNLLLFLDKADAQFTDDAKHWRSLTKRHILEHPMAVC
jgi:hypothetical protein